MGILRELWTASNVKAAIVFFFAIAVPGVFNGYQWYVNQQGKLPASIQAINNIHRANELLKHIQEQTSARKAIILKGSNGGAPRLGRPFHSSVYLEAYNSATSKPVKDKWQGELLDASYIEMLVEVAVKGFKRNVTGTMKQGKLKDVYQSAKPTPIEMSLVYKIRANEKSFFYLSVTFGTVKELTPAERNLIRYTKTKIVKLFEKIED